MCIECNVSALTVPSVYLKYCSYISYTACELNVCMCIECSVVLLNVLSRVVLNDKIELIEGVSNALHTF